MAQIQSAGLFSHVGWVEDYGFGENPGTFLLQQTSFRIFTKYYSIFLKYQRAFLKHPSVFLKYPSVFLKPVSTFYLYQKMALYHQAIFYSPFVRPYFIAAIVRSSPFALRFLPSALRFLPFALCPSPSALCPLPFALRFLLLTLKG
jgi:hypothetical protein